jgi:hypothetical protein
MHSNSNTTRSTLPCPYNSGLTDVCVARDVICRQLLSLRLLGFHKAHDVIAGFLEQVVNLHQLQTPAEDTSHNTLHLPAVKQPMNPPTFTSSSILKPPLSGDAKGKLWPAGQCSSAHKPLGIVFQVARGYCRSHWPIVCLNTVLM